MKTNQYYTDLFATYAWTNGTPITFLTTEAIMLADIKAKQGINSIFIQQWFPTAQATEIAYKCVFINTDGIAQSRYRQNGTSYPIGHYHTNGTCFFKSKEHAAAYKTQFGYDKVIKASVTAATGNWTYNDSEFIIGTILATEFDILSD